MRQMTMVSLSLVLDGQWGKNEFEQLCIGPIRKVCMRTGDKFAPEVWVDKIEIRELKVIPKG